ncbi:hypothetical protein ACF05T_19955 [Streptomyces lateritius]|uniref:Uncharacterized protein n=1 Tax=Streptomyces lateritius TaxID=67313 RepID=A0ABW6YET3_9ACTN
MVINTPEEAREIEKAEIEKVENGAEAERGPGWEQAAGVRGGKGALDEEALRQRIVAARRALDDVESEFSSLSPPRLRAHGEGSWEEKGGASVPRAPAARGGRP